MNKIKLALNTLAFFAFSLALASAAHALPQTYVSMSGNDSNPCSYASPCRTFKEGLAKADAGGEVIALETGSYGVLNITKAISIIAPPGVHAEIAPATANVNAVVIQAAALDVVVLRNLYISGLNASKGIEFKSGAALHVENCLVKGFNFGLNVNTPSLLYVKDTTIRNVRDGIRVTTPSGEVKAFIEHCRLEGYKTGVSAVDNSHVTIRDSTLLGLSRDYDVTFAGIAAIPNNGHTASVVVENCQVSNNHFGILALVSAGAALVDVSQTTISENGVGLYSFGASQITSFGNNRVNKNGTNGSFDLITELQ
ncbi:MAG: right-handed parallel beta-helix repeat-containing protein [Pyrinomonadaceae bacterium]